MLHANVADGVHRIEDAYTNWYLIEADGQLTVVDAGVPRSVEDLLQRLLLVRELQELKSAYGTITNWAWPPGQPPMST